MEDVSRWGAWSPHDLTFKRWGFYGPHEFQTLERVE
jgi:hypothetical protein